MMAKRDAVFPAGGRALYDMDRYSAAIRSGSLLFVSGRAGSREDGSPEPDFERQVQLAFDNLNAVLAAAGCTFDDVVDVTTFHTDPATQLATVIAVRAGEIGEPPIRTGPRWVPVGSRASTSRSRSSRVFPTLADVRDEQIQACTGWTRWTEPSPSLACRFLRYDQNFSTAGRTSSSIVQTVRGWR